MSKSTFSFEKHQDTGSKLKAVHRQLSTLIVEIGSSYPVGSKSCRLAEKAAKAIGELRSELENQLFRDFPARTSKDESRGVYYGETPSN